MRRRKSTRGKRRRGGAHRGAGAKKFKSAIRQMRLLKPPQQLQAMKVANDKFIKHMCREVRKLKHKQLSKPLQVRMQKNAKKIRKLISPRTSMRVKRRLVTQRGGFLPLVLGALAGNVLGSLFGRR